MSKLRDIGSAIKGEIAPQHLKKIHPIIYKEDGKFYSKYPFTKEIPPHEVRGNQVVITFKDTSTSSE